MSSQLFGTDGIRGPAGTYPLDDTGLLQIGKAVGAYFSEAGGTMLIGWDPRESSEALVASIVKGLVLSGIHVRKIGVVPTPGLAYLTKISGVDAGIMITASHNPYTDNGVKVFTPDGRKLSDKAQIGLNKLIDEDVPERDGGSVEEDMGVVSRYEDFLVGIAQTSFADMRIALDTANGATSGIAARVFERLRADVTPMFDKPDGRNINVACGATDTKALQVAVKKQGLTAGAAFDGDGDRVMLIDEKGRELTGDHILYILAVAGGQKGVVATVMSNQGLETSLEKHGIRLERTPVGDRSVLHGMDQTGYTLGGEQSGHIIISEYADTGDGMLAAIRTLALVSASGKTLAGWYDDLHLLPQALVNVPVADKRVLSRTDIQAFISSQTDELKDEGRLLIRPSGTEPKVRVMVESPDARERAERIAEQLSELARSSS